MALVKCPKCGETVSSTALKCVHCGASFHGTCFECGGLLLEGETMCRNCGAVKEKALESQATPVSDLQEEIKEESTDGITEAEGEKIETEMLSIMQKRKEQDKKFGIWKFFLEMAMLAFLIIPIYQIYKNLKNAENLFDYLKLKEEGATSIIFMLIISTMLDIGAMIIQIYTISNKDKLQMQEMAALGKEKWRYYIKRNASKSRDDKEQAAFDNVLKIGYFLENPDKTGNSTFLKISMVIRMCVNIVGSIVMSMLVYGMYELGIKTATNDMWKLFVAKFKDLLTPLLTLLIIGLPLVIVESVLEAKMKKEAKLYQESILAEETELKNE